MNPDSSIHIDFIRDNTTIDTIDNQITLVENPMEGYEESYPVKLDEVVAVICEEGTMRGAVDLKKFTASAPCLFIVLSGQILQCEDFSSDFKGQGIIMSREFWNDFPIDNSLGFPLSRSIRENPSIGLTRDELESMLDYFRLMQKTIRKHENPNRSEAVKYLTIAFFYGFGYPFHRINEEAEGRKRDILVDRFLSYVRENYKEHRDIEFYAGKLFLTPKYLSKALKQKSGKTANDWIEDHVILEARALLKSTNLTVQQISEELNFPSQSFFGKYFKRRVGISPAAYRKG